MANYKVISSEALIELFEQALNDEWGYIWGTAGEMWTAAKQENLNKTTDADRANSRKYGAKWIGHMVADCSGLFSWAFKKLGSYMYHGSDTMYRKYCKYHGELNKGQRTDGQALKPGTAVFCWNGKKYSHVGLYVGNGVVIEAAGSQQGVIKSKVTATKWKYWGELINVSFDAKGDDTVVWHPTIRRGSKGDDVREAQTILYNLGYGLGSYGIDGDFGKATEAAVKEFQRDHGLTQDGVVGPMTWDALLNTNAPKPPTEKLYTVSIHHLDKTQADAIKNNYPGATITEE